MRWMFILTLLAASLACLADTTKPTYLPPTVEDTIATQKVGRYLATITMENGKTIEIVLEGNLAPYTVANFVKLAQAKFYDGLTFHRAEPGFVIQGGDPLANGQGGPGYNINLEVSPFLRQYKGAVAMAHAKSPDSAGSQFYIDLTNPTWLEYQFAVFGWVKKGMDVAESIVVAVKEKDTAGYTMKSVVVQPYDGKEACPILDTKIPEKDPEPPAPTVEPPAPTVGTDNK